MVENVLFEKVITKIGAKIMNNLEFGKKTKTVVRNR